MRRFSRVTTGLLASVLAAGMLAGGGHGGTAAAAAPDHDRVVGAEPAAQTPDIQDGYPQAILPLDGRVLVGGTFHEVRDPGQGTLHEQPYLFAYDRATGEVDTSFAPELGNEVTALHPGPQPGTVYVGGRFNHADGHQGWNKLVLLDVADGSVVTEFRVPAMNGAVQTVHTADGRLYAGGTFTHVGVEEKNGLVALDPATGDIDPFLDVPLTGHHNYDGESGARGPVGAAALDIAPDGETAVVVGNFAEADGHERHQTVLLDLTGSSAEVADWHTAHFDPRCSWRSFDKWVRDVAFSPDGSYFVVVTTGGHHLDTLCDTASRWETAPGATAPQHPTWVNWTGGDTLLSVAVTETAVYVGGHQRWQNNHRGSDTARTGAVGRPGLAALDPTSGVPLSWNPGRNPRGYGATALHADAHGLYVGSDTDYIGNWEYQRGRLAFFPHDEGAAPPAGEAATLPADVHLTDAEVDIGSGAPQVLYRVNAAGGAVPATDGGPDWEADDAWTHEYRNTGSHRTTLSDEVPRVDDSVPESTPREVFDSTRWDPTGDPEMVWSFPVPEDTEVELRLSFADRCWCTHEPGDRVMDILVDGETVAEDVDVVDAVGYNEAMTLTVPVTSDGTVDVEFRHVVENPMVSALELVRVSDPEDDGTGIAARSFDGAQAGEAVDVAGPDGTDWGALRGGFLVDDTLFYGTADGSFWRRSFDDGALGAPEELTPHSDPYWDGVPTHSGDTTYDGVPTSFAADIDQTRAMYFRDGKLFYTRAGDNRLYWRWFDPESGLAGSREFTLAGEGSAGDPAYLGDTSGVLFVSDGYVYWSRQADGDLVRRPLEDRGPAQEQVTTDGGASVQFAWDGPAEVVSGPSVDGVDWRTPGAFLDAS